MAKRITLERNPTTLVGKWKGKHSKHLTVKIVKSLMSVTFLCTLISLSMCSIHFCNLNKPFLVAIVLLMRKNCSLIQYKFLMRLTNHETKLFNKVTTTWPTKVDTFSMTEE